MTPLGPYAWHPRQVPPRRMPPSPSRWTWRAVVLATATLVASGVGVLELLQCSACATHVLGDTDTAALRDSVELAARSYLASDGGRVRAYSRAIYCSDLGVLERSGVHVEAGPAPITCEVAK